MNGLYSLMNGQIRLFHWPYQENGQHVQVEEDCAIFLKIYALLECSHYRVHQIQSHYYVLNHEEDVTFLVEIRDQ